MRFTIAALALFSLLAISCSGDKSRIDNAKFEIEQGNFANARRLLTSLPAGSDQKAVADSLLKSIEGR